MKLDYPSIVTELVMALRGSRSAAEVSRLMGFGFNQVRRWEAGEKQLRWDEFCHYCEALQIPLVAALRDNFTFTWPDLESFPRYLRTNCFPYYTVEEIAEKLHRHPSAIRRYLEGEVFPDLEFILAFIDLDLQRLPRFLLDLLPSQHQSDFRKQLEVDVQHLDEVALRPILAAVKHWLNTSTYIDMAAHDDSFLAEKLNCSVDEVKHHLSELIRIDGAKRDENGKYIPLHLSTHIGTSNRQLYRETQQYWYGRVAQFYERSYPKQKGPVGRMVTSRIVSMSPQKAEQVNEIIARAYSEITGLLVEDDEPQNDVRLVLMGSFSIQDLF